ncbi:MAG: DUF4380 domain-containing protein [Cyclobacteriaceae bacterium]|nr:DUF4380 domain-containing protein [Cyclobacteriaceae bacterium]
MILKALFCIVVLSMVYVSTERRPAVTQLENGLFSISHENVSFLINPAIGARVISAKVGQKELLLQERNELLNWGATFWPAPQRDWNWPPPQAFQYGEYVPEIKGNRLILTGATDPKLGLRVVKTFSFDEVKNCLEIEYQIINESDSVANVGPWEIVCVPAAGSKVFLSLGAEPENVNSSLAFENHAGIGWFDHDSADLLPNQKLFNNTPEGWLAHINRDGILFIKTFEVIPAGELAPGQGNAEVYVSKKFEYIELENHGKFAHLKPQESLHYKVRWFMSELPAGISSSILSDELIDHVRSVTK